MALIAPCHSGISLVKWHGGSETLPHNKVVVARGPDTVILKVLPNF